MNNMYDVLADKLSAESLADRLALENANEELRVGNAVRSQLKMSLPEQNKKFKNIRSTILLKKVIEKRVGTFDIIYQVGILILLLAIVMISVTAFEPESDNA